MNFVDLVDTPNTGRCASQFDSLKGLQEYTLATGI